MVGTKSSDLMEITRDGRVVFHFHPGQIRAWKAQERVVAVIAGTQSGKTSFGPVWLWREMRLKGPGDYLIATPTFPLLELKLLPEFKRLFETILKLGKLTYSPNPKFHLSEAGEIAMFGSPQDTPTTVHFGYARNPDSLESMTAKAAWLDEAGQKDFKVGSYEAIQRRLAIHDGRMLITTTPYELGWLKSRIWAKRKTETDIRVVRFDSTMNPLFPQEVMDRARRDLPRWKFNMFYRGIFSRPAGMIYDNFDDNIHTCPRFPIPDAWERNVGTDFGGVNTAGIFLAEDPGTKKLYAYREYHAGGRTAAGHTTALLAHEPGVPTRIFGGAKSEQQWRDEFRAAGFPIKEPAVSDVEVGIDRVYGAFSRNEIVIFDDLTDLLEEINTYSRETDDFGEPTEKIDDKNKFHRLDALRYIISSVRGLSTGETSALFDNETGPGSVDEELAWAESYSDYDDY